MTAMTDAAAAHTPDLSAPHAVRDHGVRSPVRIISEEQAAHARAAIEHAEAEIGSLHYRHKVETALRTVWDLATSPAVLDAVEAFLGPDILLYNATLIIKEPGSEANVAWHQDLTYWGLSDDEGQLSMWLALAPAPIEAGCMRMVPGSHYQGGLDHETGAGDGNVLQLGQYLPGVDESEAVYVPLAAGEASFHHGWTVHASSPNVSDDRRIGLNVQFLAPHVSFIGGECSPCALVRGVDAHGNFPASVRPDHDLEPAAMARWAIEERRMTNGFETVGDDTTG